VIHFVVLGHILSKNIDVSNKFCFLISVYFSAPHPLNTPGAKVKKGGPSAVKGYCLLMYLGDTHE
jgi:hypothetical protein